MAIKRILAFRNDRFGEFLLNIPAFRALKRAFPGAQLILAVNPYTEEIAHCVDCVDEVLTFENRKHNLFELINLGRKLRKKEIGLCVIFNPSREFNIVSIVAGIPLRIGYNRKLGFLLNRKMLDKKYLGEKHEIEYNLDLVGLIDAKGCPEDLSLKVNENLADRFLVGFHTPDIIALHPWTSDPLKQWPQERFLEVAMLIMNELGKKVVLIGGKEEIEKSKVYEGKFGNNLINLTGKTSLVELAAILKKCRLLVSCDSGPVHLASCVSTPVLAIFRNDLPGKGPKRWGPKGTDSIVVQKPELKDISSEEVFNEIKRMVTK